LTCALSVVHDETGHTRFGSVRAYRQGVGVLRMPYIHQQHNFERRVRRRVSSASNSRRERPTATAVATAALLLLLLLDSLTGVGNISRPFRPAMSHPIALRHRAWACRYPPTLLQVSSRWSRACLGKTTVCLKNGHVKKDISSHRRSGWPACTQTPGRATTIGLACVCPKPVLAKGGRLKA
jgi:hypothetical protein